jgi:uncharacterized membrane protein
MAQAPLAAHIGAMALFTLLFAAAFLRGVERITTRHLVGTALVVAGVIVLSAF